MRRPAALLFLALFLLPATGAGMELVLCDDCLQMAAFSCCTFETDENGCEEECGSCEDDTTVSVRAIPTSPAASGILPPTPGVFDYISSAYATQSPHPRAPRVTIPPHIPTTVILS